LNRRASRGDALAASQLRASLDLMGIFLDPIHFEKFLLLNRVVTRVGEESPSVAETIRRLRSEHLNSIGRSEAEIDGLVSKRLEARASKNWAESDRIRDELASMGVALKDNKDGTTTWEVKR